MKIFCIGRNYADHAAEMGSEVPKEPLVFMKPPSAILNNNKSFYIPEFSQEIHYEGEIVVKLCKNGKHIQPPFAKRYYKEVAFGFDMTARDLQRKCKKEGIPWEIAKGFDNSAPLSQFIPIKSDEFSSLTIRTELNGKVVQAASAIDMIFTIDQLIVHLSKYFKLQIGDLIFTGTPAGVGPIAPGDTLKGYLNDNHMITCKIK